MARSAEEIQDELLVVGCRRGDPNAWDRLIARYSGRLTYYLRRLLEDEDAVRNSLQEVWLGVLRGIGSLRRGQRLAPWLYAIARNTAMSHHRSRYREAARRAEDDVEVLDEQAADPSQLENAELVHFGLEQIGLVEREALTLFFLEDLTIDEIAQVLEVPLGTVKSRLHRARRDLRRVLQREVTRHDR